MRQYNDKIVPVIPLFNEDGNLPAGIYPATWEEIEVRFGRTPRRQKLLQGLREVLIHLKDAGCVMVYLDGSFVTRKQTPQDFDLCWNPELVDVARLDPVFFDFSRRRRAQKERFSGEFFPANAPAGWDGESFFHFFQHCKRTGHAKGLLAMDLSLWEEPLPEKTKKEQESL